MPTLCWLISITSDYSSLPSDRQSRVITTLFYPLTIHFMFKTFRSNSSAVECMSADAIRGTVCAKFKDDSIYIYNNVSRRAILNLIANPNMSVGFWLNANVINNERVTCFA